MYELRPNDVMWLEEVGVFRVHDMPQRQEDGVWAVNADNEIDPATNQWRDKVTIPAS